MKRRSRRPAASGTKRSLRSRRRDHGPSGTTTGSHSGTTSSQDPGRAEIRCRLNSKEVLLILESLSQYREDIRVRDPTGVNYEGSMKRRELQQLWARLEAASHNLKHPGTKSYAKRS